MIVMKIMIGRYGGGDVNGIGSWIRGYVGGRVM